MQVPVLLLGGINVARAFGLAGIPVVVLSPDPDEPALASRYCCEGEVIAPLDDEASVLASLERVGRRLARRFGTRLPLADADLGTALLDKAKFGELARKLDLPVPRILSWTGEDTDPLDRFEGPVIV